MPHFHSAMEQGIHPAGKARSGAVVLPRRNHGFQSLPVWVWCVAGGLAIAGLFTANPLLTPFCILMLPVLATLLWIPGEPPVLAFACGMQWLQASAAIFYANSYGRPLAFEHDGQQLELATWLSLVGILALAMGMKLAQWRRTYRGDEDVKRETLMLEPVRLLLCYVAALGIPYLVSATLALAPGLVQAVRALAMLRWIPVFLLAQVVLTRRRGYWLLGIVVVHELATGFLGFFGGFKGIFFVLLVVLPTAGYLFKGWRLVQSVLLVLAIGVFASIWTAIKPEYREFLNQGTGEQVVLVPVGERFQKLGELIGGLDRNSIALGLEDAILRVSYVSFFAATIGNVPSHIPYEQGGLWWGAVRHVLMPRLFFPDKPAIEDSQRVVKYAGIEVAGAEQGTSISLGYMAESYIDFGPVGMFIPIFLLGMFYGMIYRYFIGHYQLRLLGFAMATSILAFGAYMIETSNIKLVGGNVTSFIVLWAFAKFCGPPFWSLVAPRHSASPGHAKHRVVRRTRRTSHLAQKPSPPTGGSVGIRSP